jgi:hypothetical protein
MKRLTLALAILFMLFISACSPTPPANYSGTYSTEGPVNCALKVAQQAADQISFELLCALGMAPYNTGEAAGTIPLVENIALYSVTYAGQCEIRFEFSTGQVIVSQSGSDADCGFGMGVNVAGTYLLNEPGVPKFSCLKLGFCTPTPEP